MHISRSTAAKTGETGRHNLIQDASILKVLKKETVILEEAGIKRPVMRLTGRFQYADEPNANGRIYEFPILKNAVDEIQEDLKARRILGEFDHPADAKIHLDRISHVITKIWMEDKEVLGELEVLEKTSCGAQLKALVESGVSIGISSRGVGDMESIVVEGKELNRVLEGYLFITWDVVAEPSVAGSYLGVMESRNRMLRSKQLSDPFKTKEHNIIKEIHNYLNKI